MGKVLKPSELSFFQKLNEHEVRFIVVGMSAAVLQGSHLLTEDIDIWVDNLGGDKFKLAVTEAGGIYVPPAVAGMNPPMLGPESLSAIDLVTNAQGLGTFDDEYVLAMDMELEGIRLKVLTVERVIISKKTANSCLLYTSDAADE